MEKPRLSPQFDTELTDLANGLAGFDNVSGGNSNTTLERVADLSSIPNIIYAGATPRPSVSANALKLEAHQRIRGTNEGRWLSDGPPPNLNACIEIMNKRLAEPAVVIAPLGQMGRRFAEKNPQAMEDVATIRCLGGMISILRSLGYSEAEAEGFLEREYPQAQREVYVTSEGGQAIVQGLTIDIPGKGQMHVQKLHPDNGTFLDAQVVFAPEGSVVVPQTSAA